MYADHCRHDD